MLIKFDAPDELAEQIKGITGSAVASKAFLSAAQQFLTLRARVKQLEQQNVIAQQQADKKIAKLQEQCELKDAVILKAQDAARTLLNHVEKKKKTKPS